uniref:mitogen-activated protein kinase kinase n=1 Tax=Acrobeloides nanus TaxID=290746 RepID=A0A914DYM2_9BILA
MIGEVKTDTPVGTLRYCAPERFSRDYEYKVDVWSLGITLVEIALGYHPFEEDDENLFIILPTINSGIIDKIVAPLVAQYSQQAIDFIKACLTIEDKRRPTSRELRELSFYNNPTRSHEERKENIKAHLVKKPTLSTSRQSISELFDKLVDKSNPDLKTRFHETQTLLDKEDQDFQPVQATIEEKTKLPEIVTKPTASSKHKSESKKTNNGKEQEEAKKKYNIEKLEEDLE